MHVGQMSAVQQRRLRRSTDIGVATCSAIALRPMPSCLPPRCFAYGVRHDRFL
ncbi:hypothetical protein XHC_2377 [Xanthomonas hortorum pv. carotae str. M081]|nr:hypothetical protein XHC_2377 [Xanthomonas hortorum pv. carotae str. M081]